MNKKILIYGLFILLLVNLCFAYPFFKISFSININNEVSTTNIKVKDISLPVPEIKNSSYSIEFYDSFNYPLTKSHFEPKLYTETLSGIYIKENTTVYVELPYSDKIESFRIMFGDEILFNDSIGKYMCNYDDKCDFFETYESCKSDCSSGSRDDYCDNIEDGICDPDCTLLDKKDCSEKKRIKPTKDVSKLPINYFIIIGIAILAFIGYKFYKKYL